MTTRTRIVSLLALSLALVPRAGSAEQVTQATASLRNTQGVDVGTVRLRDTPTGLLIHARLHGLPPGERAFHIHETGRCDPPFESAGDHLAPGGTRHGFLDEHGPHGGDLVNLVVPEGGRVETTMRAPELRMSQVLDEDGSALVIHANQDDYESQPSGGAGDRIACGVVEAAAPKP